MNHPAWQQAVLQILVPLLPAQEARARAGPQATVGSPGPQKQMEAVGRPRAGRVAFTSQLVCSCIPELGGDLSPRDSGWPAPQASLPGSQAQWEPPGVCLPSRRPLSCHCAAGALGAPP